MIWNEHKWTSGCCSRWLCVQSWSAWWTAAVCSSISFQTQNTEHTDCVCLLLFLLGHCCSVCMLNICLRDETTESWRIMALSLKGFQISLSYRESCRHTSHTHTRWWLLFYWSPPLQHYHPHTLFHSQGQPLQRTGFISNPRPFALYHSPFSLSPFTSVIFQLLCINTSKKNQKPQKVKRTEKIITHWDFSEIKKVTGVKSMLWFNNVSHCPQ